MTIELVIKEAKDYPPENKKIFNFLTLLGNYNVVGSASLKQIEYSDDYDLNEMVKCRKDKDVYRVILDTFREKYEMADKSDNIYITDFKCGERNSIPLRWDKQSIKDGYQYQEDTKIYFTDCLQQPSTIKLDLIVYEDKSFTEYSEIYFLSFGDTKAYDEYMFYDIETKLRLEIHELQSEGKYYKSLKRYLSLLRLREKKEQGGLDKLIKFLNSPTGQLSSIKNDLELIKEVMDQTFKPVPVYQIRNALETIKKNIRPELRGMIDEILSNSSRIEVVINYLNEIVQKETEEFIENNNLIIF
jgi:hypothetical protein